MKKLFNAWMFALVMGSLLLTGCSKELTYYPPEIRCEGVALTSSDNGVNYTGTIPQEGTEFVITCSQPITNIVIKRGANNVEVWNPAISGGYWGEIISESENRYRFKINSNTSDSDRDLIFTFGTNFESCRITLRQVH